jgi:hypothetical protein
MQAKTDLHIPFTQIHQFAPSISLPFFVSLYTHTDLNFYLFQFIWEQAAVKQLRYSSAPKYYSISEYFS